MIDDNIPHTTPPKTSSELLKERYENRPLPPPAFRLGTPQEIGHHACERKKVTGHRVDNFAEYLSSLQGDQKTLFDGNGGYSKKSLRNQMDLLDAMFKYLAVNADYKRETPQSYNAALRAQKQFCDTIKMMMTLKKSPPTPAKSR
jgi:hypothetical protein